MRQWMNGTAIALALVASAPAMAKPATPAKAASLIPVETFVLPNGLRVVMNVDRSDPVAAVALVAHVGSAREVTGRTGFAHMFEHLFFLNSENLGPGGLDKLSARIGGEGANGYTNFDQTVYLQTAPRDALEKLIWAEADKLGYFINTVTPAVVAKEIQVVKNEKRQSYDNRPYGQSTIIMQNALFPADHPYSWPTIGSLADLDAATLDDVKAFYRRWYSPNNATLVISGDIDTAQTRQWVEKYFGEIPRGPEVAIPQPRPGSLTAIKRLMHVDNLVKLPQLTLGGTTVPDYTPDAFALTILMQVLTAEPDGPLYKSVVETAKLSDKVDGLDWGNQLTSIFGIEVRAFEGVDLDRVQAALDQGFMAFERDGVSPAQLERVKTAAEKEFYDQIGSVRGKVQVIADYETALRRPDFVDENLAGLRRVTTADVMRVYNKYLKGQAYVALSTVPKGQEALALSGSVPAKVTEEAIVQGAEKPVDQTAGRGEIQRTPSSFDRTIEPPAGAAPVVKAPPVWTASLPGGLPLSGIEDRELPVAGFQIAIDGGHLRDVPGKPGTAYLTAEMLTRGTRSKTREQFENALKSLGADVTVTVGEERTIVSVSTLARNFAATAALVEEMLLQPRWDANELALAKAAATAELQALQANPTYLANAVAAQVSYGRDSILAKNVRGTPASIAAITVDDLKAYQTAAYSPKAARIRVAGAVSQVEASRAFAGLASHWTGPALPTAGSLAFAAPARTQVYFYDVPGAKQSQLLFLTPGPTRADPDYFTARSSNFILGGGGFASRLTQELREGKGYTYGIRSSFDGTATGGRFAVASPVRANVTLEAATLTRDIVRDYGKTFTAADLELTKGSLIKARARQFETLQAKMGLLADIGDYGLPADYIARENAQLSALTADQVRAIAGRYFDTDRMTIVVVGDAATQASRLSALGYGAPVIVKSVD